jgi:hypothetical protein
MSELEMTIDAETEDFTDELADEALDRESTKVCIACDFSKN